jgi:outer membrane protein TolC
LLQWDLWDGKLTRAKVREANANLESTREEERKLRLALDFEVERARLDLKAANERLSVTDQVVAQATESASLTRARFEQELSLPTELIDAETALVNARVRRAEAEADREIAIAAVRKALALPQLDSQAKAR